MGWLENGGYAELEKYGYDAEAMIQQTKDIESDAAVRARRLVNNFLDQVATVPI